MRESGAALRERVLAYAENYARQICPQGEARGERARVYQSAGRDTGFKTVKHTAGEKDRRATKRYQKDKIRKPAAENRLSALQRAEPAALRCKQRTVR